METYEPWPVGKEVPKTWPSDPREGEVIFQRVLARSKLTLSQPAAYKSPVAYAPKKQAVLVRLKAALPDNEMDWLRFGVSVSIITLSLIALGYEKLWSIAQALWAMACDCYQFFSVWENCKLAAAILTGSISVTYLIFEAITRLDEIEEAKKAKAAALALEQERERKKQSTIEAAAAAFQRSPQKVGGVYGSARASEDYEIDAALRGHTGGFSPMFEE